jgi:hypothetical protein
MPKGQKSEIKRPAFAKPTTWQTGVSRRRVRLGANFSCFRRFPIHRFLMSGKVCSHRQRPGWRIARYVLGGRGTMSTLAHEHPKELVGKLEAAGARCDFREPNSLPAVAGHPRRADTTFMTRSMTFGGSRRFRLSVRTSPRATYQIRLWRLSFVQAISAGSIGID